MFSITVHETVCPVSKRGIRGSPRRDKLKLEDLSFSDKGGVFLARDYTYVPKHNTNIDLLFKGVSISSFQYKAGTRDYSLDGVYGSILIHFLPIEIVVELPWEVMDELYNP